MQASASTCFFVNGRNCLTEGFGVVPFIVHQRVDVRSVSAVRSCRPFEVL